MFRLSDGLANVKEWWVTNCKNFLAARLEKVTVIYVTAVVKHHCCNLVKHHDSVPFHQFRQVVSIQLFKLLTRQVVKPRMTFFHQPLTYTDYACFDFFKTDCSQVSHVCGRCVLQQ